MQCLHPISIRTTPINKETGEMGRTYQMLVPCRKCIACKSNRRSEWSFRLLYEALDAEHHNYFITLTYSDETLPIHEFTEGYQPCFSKEDVQKFFKRLRRHYEPVKIRFFLSSEYGTKTLRPHYHACVFNVPDDLLTFRRVLERTWSKGRIQADCLNVQRMGYVSKYIMKQDFLDDLGRSDLRTPFMLCSKGIGRSYADIYSSSHKGDTLRSYAVGFDNVKVSIPRYLKNKIFSDSERLELVHQSSLYHLSHPTIVNHSFELDNKLEKQIKSIISKRSKL